MQLSSQSLAPFSLSALPTALEYACCVSFQLSNCVPREATSKADASRVLLGPHTSISFSLAVRSKTLVLYTHGVHMS